MNHKSGGLKIDGKTLLNHLQELGNTRADYGERRPDADSADRCGKAGA